MIKERETLPGIKLNSVSERLWDELYRLLPYYLKLNPVRVTVFGSLARGNVREDSDIDVFVETDDNKYYYEYIDALYAFGYNSDECIDLIIESEPSEKVMQEYPIYSIIREEGVVVYERDSNSGEQAFEDDDEFNEQTLLGEEDV